MNKVIFLLIGLIANSAMAQNINFFKEQKRIESNKIQFLTMYSYGFTNGTKSTDSTKSWIRTYDKNGIQLSQYSFINSGKDSTLVEYTFDSKKMTFTSFTYTGGSSDFYFKSELQLDPAGHKVRSQDYNGKGELIKYREHVLDEEQKLIFGTSYWPDGRTDRKRIDEYDEDGKIIKIKYYNRNNPKQLWSTIVFEYDSKNQIVSEMVYIEREPKSYRKYFYKYY